MNLELNLKTKIATMVVFVLLVKIPMASADPVVAGEILPPASATLITDTELTQAIAIGPPSEPVWCYSNDANAILVSAPQRVREQCELKLEQELQKAKAEFDYFQNQLIISIESLNKKYDTMMRIKNDEIEQLTQAALKRPNDYSLWWASGGVIAGVATTLAIVFMVSK